MPSIVGVGQALTLVVNIKQGIAKGRTFELIGVNHVCDRRLGFWRVGGHWGLDAGAYLYIGHATIPVLYTSRPVASATLRTIIHIHWSNGQFHIFSQENSNSALSVWKKLLLIKKVIFFSRSITLSIKPLFGTRLGKQHGCGLSTKLFLCFTMS